MQETKPNEIIQQEPNRLVICNHNPGTDLLFSKHSTSYSLEDVTSLGQRSKREVPFKEIQVFVTHICKRISLYSLTSEITFLRRSNSLPFFDFPLNRVQHWNNRLPNGRLFSSCVFLTLQLSRKMINVEKHEKNMWKISDTDWLWINFQFSDCYNIFKCIYII